MNDRLPLPPVIVLLILGSLVIPNVSSACASDGDCLSAYSRYCCKGTGVCSYDCKGKNCSLSTDCAFGESCCSGYCQSGITCYCTTSYSCGTGRSCCNDRCRSGYNCLGQSCVFDSDCDTAEVCCNGICNAGYSCNTSLAGWIIAIIIISIVLMFGIPITCCVIGIFCAVGPCKNRSRSRGHVAANPTTMTTTTVAVPPPGAYPQQPPPGAQQPYYPPPGQNQPPPAHAYGPPPPGVPYQQPGAPYQQPGAPYQQPGVAYQQPGAPGVAPPPAYGKQ